MADGSEVIIARVEDLAAQCPGNSLVWEFVQLKNMKRIELAERIQVMIDRQYECRGDPDYIDRNDHIGYNASYRRKIIELYLTVGPH
jgi:hypothetical protein